MSFIESPDALFHFTKYSTFVKHIGPNMSLLANIRKKSRNPDEYKDWKYLFTEPKYVNKVGVNLINEIDEFEKKINDVVKNDYQLLCFCRNVFQKGKLIRPGYAKPRMWSQYAEDNSGVCLVFSKIELNKQIESQLKNDSYYSRNIMYRSYGNIIKTKRRLSWHQVKFQLNYHNDFVLDNLGKIFFTKDSDFNDEVEFRFVLESKNKNASYVNIKTSLKYIICGDRCKPAKQKQIAGLAKKMKVGAFQIIWNNNEFTLEEL